MALGVIGAFPLSSPFWLSVKANMSYRPRLAELHKCVWGDPCCLTYRLESSSVLPRESVGI